MENTREAYLKKIEELKIENRIKMIDALTRQIPESRDECEILLENNNYDIMNTIRKYYDIKKEEEKEKNKNTLIFESMREIMDEASEKYYKEKDIKEAKEKIVEKYKNMNQQSDTREGS